MANLNDEFNKAAKEFKEMVDGLKNSEKTKDALKELQEIKESGSNNLNEVKKFKEETKERISKAAVYDEEATNRSIFSLKSLFSCSGRLGKKGYGILNVALYTAFIIIIYSIFAFEGYTRIYSLSAPIILITYATFCAIYIFALVRRLHDCGKNGVPVLLAIPFAIMCHSYGRDWHMAPLGISVVVALFMALQPGTDGDNAYGPIPPEYNLGSFVKNVLNAIREKINFAINAARRFLKGNAKRIALGIGTMIALSCIGIYLYVPKVSDVEEYKVNQDVDKLTQLIDKTTEWQMFLDVRAEAIKGLVALKNDKSEAYIERILHGKYVGNYYELRDEVLKYCINLDDAFVIKRIDKYFKEILDLPEPIYFSDVRDGAYTKILHLSSLSKDKKDKVYAATLIALHCSTIVEKDGYSGPDEISYLLQHIEMYGELLPNPNLAKSFVEAIGQYREGTKNVVSMENTMKNYIARKEDLAKKIQYWLKGTVVKVFNVNSYSVELNSGGIVRLYSDHRAPFSYGEQISVPVTSNGFMYWVDIKNMREEKKLMKEIYDYVPKYEEYMAHAAKCISELKISFAAFHKSLEEYIIKHSESN